MIDDRHYDAPEWPFRVLKSFCKDALVERIEGDLLETYDYHAKKYGESKARWLLYRDVISMFRPFAIKGIKNNNYSIMMLSNYFKLTIRGIKTNKTTSFISIFGLAVAISCCIILFLFSMNIITANSFIKNADEIYMVTSKTKTINGDPFIWGKSPASLGAAVMEDIGNMEYVSGFTHGSAVIRYKDVVLEEPIQFVDADFLNIFSFSIQSGNRSALTDPGRVVLTAKVAEKFFGTSDPIDKEMTMIIDGKSVPIVVGAIADKFPTNAYFNFNILVNSTLNPVKNDQWTALSDATFLKFNNEVAFDEFNNQKHAYIEAYNAGNPRYTIDDLNLIRFDTITNTIIDIVNNVVGRENPSTLYGGIFFGLLLLFIACFNYINIALVSATKRLKEIGLRKSVGASRGQLIAQFLSQNIFLSLFAVFLGLIAAQVVLLPLFNSFFPFDFSIDYTSIYLWIFLIGIAVLTGFLSGLYPALYISSFSANNIFKGSLKLGSNHNYLFKFFLGVQFGITFLIIFSGIAFMANSTFQKQLPWGYDQSGTLVIPMEKYDQYQSLKTRLNQYPEVVSLAGAMHHVGDQSGSLDILFNNEKSTVRAYHVSPDYLKTMRFTLNQGVFFNPLKASDIQNGIIVNESFIKQYFIENTQSEVVKTSEKDYHIIGVIEDFHYRNFYAPIEPIVFCVSQEEKEQFLAIRVQNDTQMANLEKNIKADWASMFPDFPYQGYRQDTTFDNFFREMSIPTKILILFSVISIILSSIGLYGLVSLMLAKRMREISIRKIMGANMQHISIITNKPFIIILGVALLLAIPCSQWLVKDYLDQVNAYHVSIDAKIIIPSVVLIALTILLTIGANLLKIAKAQPTATLREK